MTLAPFHPSGRPDRARTALASDGPDPVTVPLLLPAGCSTTAGDFTLSGLLDDHSPPGPSGWEARCRAPLAVFAATAPPQ